MGFYGHAGFCAALEERGVRPGHVSGSSAGAMIAAFLGAGLGAAEIKQIVFDPAFRWSFWEWRSFLRGLGMTFVLPGAVGLSRAEKTRRYLSGVFARSRADLADFHPKTHLAVANLSTLRSELVCTGDPTAALLASCAFPVMLCPVRLPQGTCMDGGVANSCPTAHYASVPEIRRVLTHSITHLGKREDWPSPQRRPRISEVFGRAHQLITNEFQALQEEKLRAAGVALDPYVTSVPRPGFFTGRGGMEGQYAAGYATGLTVTL
jgi:NTE family protein